MSDRYLDTRPGLPDAGTASQGTPVIDRAVLEAVLSAGGDELRADLLAQIIADLARLQTGLQASGADRHAGIAHELKGLAATIGATALADLAACYQSLAEDGKYPGELQDSLCKGIAELRLRLSSEAMLARSA